MDKLEESKMKELLAKALEGDKTAFEEIYRHNEKLVYFICLSFLKNEHDAADVSQEVWISVIKNLKTLEDSAKFVSWLNRISVNKCKDFLKKKNPIPVAEEVLGELITEEEEFFLPEEYISIQAKRRIIMDIMRETLSDTLYQTIILFYFNNMSISEIAEIMECPEGTVSYRLSAARVKIKEGVQKYEKENSDKLHSIAFIPFLFAVFNAEMQSLNSQAMPVEITSFFASQNTAAIKAAEKGVTSMFKTFKAKIIAAIAVIVLVVGGIIGAVVISGSSDNDKKRTEVSKKDKEHSNEEDKGGNADGQDGTGENTGNDDGNGGAVGNDTNDGDGSGSGENQNSGTGNDVSGENADYIAMAEKAAVTLENYFIALKTGDVETLLELTRPEEDCYDILEDLSEQDYTGEFLRAMFGDLQYKIDDNIIQLLAARIEDSYRLDNSVIPNIPVPHAYPLFMMQNYYYMELYGAGESIPDMPVSGDRESMDLISQVIKMLPLVQGSSIGITRPDENGNILICGDGIFDWIYLDRLKRTDSGLPTRYVYDVMLKVDDAIKGDDGIYSDYAYDRMNEEYVKTCEFLVNKDFEGFREWLKDYMGDEFGESNWVHVADYASFTDSQKKWVDDYIQEKVSFKIIDYILEKSDGTLYRNGRFILTTPVLYDNLSTYDYAEWYEENNIMCYTIVFPGTDTMQGIDGLLFWYNEILYYAEQYIQ